MVEFAQCLKAARHQFAVQTLRQIGYPELADQISIQPFCQRQGLSIRSRAEIERNRHTAGVLGDIWSFYMKRPARITAIDSRLILNADETMMSSKSVAKSVTERENCLLELIMSESEDRMWAVKGWYSLLKATRDMIGIVTVRFLLNPGYCGNAEQFCLLRLFVLDLLVFHEEFGIDYHAVIARVVQVMPIVPEHCSGAC